MVLAACTGKNKHVTVSDKHVTQAIAACTTRQSPRYVEVEGSRTEGGGALPPPATGSTSRGPWEELRSSQGVCLVCRSFGLASRQLSPGPR